MVKDEIRQRFGVAEDKLRLIYNAVDAQAFSPALREGRAATLASLGIPIEALVFLLVGSGFERKGVATAIEALAELSADAHLVVVGREKHLDRYRALAEDAGLRARVHFTGPVTDPKRFYGAADAFVLPTLYDPLPNAALEAMACALPVITTTKSGAAELVVGHDAGFVCPSRDVAGLAARMRELADPSLRSRLGANAREAVLPLTPEAMTLKLVLLYKELLEASARAQKSDFARKLQAHRDAWAAKARPAERAAAAEVPVAPDATLPPESHDDKPA
jgi:UDP-glucose:(heptosyl)LPS alpha-1,3-glucosyltransferase